MKKRVISTEEAPAAIGPYNQAVIANEMVYVSGQIAIDPRTGQLECINIETETNQVLQNVQAVLEAAGSSMVNVVMCTIFVRDMSQYDTINQIYATYFPEEMAPARALVEVSRLPKDVNIEMAVVAALV